jgi:hypothetical protein
MSAFAWIPEIIMEARAANVRANPAGPHGTLDQLKAGGAASIGTCTLEK